MKNITVSAKTYDEAITKALIQLQTTSDHMVVEVIEKGTAGLFGMIGARPWTISAHVKSEEEEAAEAAAKAKEAAAKAAAERKAAQEKAAAEKKAAQEKAAAEKKAAQEKAAAERKAAEEKAAAEKKAAKAASQENKEAAEEPKEEKKRSQKPQKGSDRKDRKKDDRREKAPRDDRAKGARRREEPVGREVMKDEADEIRQRAVDFLNEVFKAMDETISIDTDFNYQDNELSVLLSGDDMGVLIGKRGQTLDSLQYLVSLVVNKHRDVYIRVKLDTENYRERREQKLKSLARNIAHKVKRNRKPVALEPMNPYERRIIHSALQRDPYVTTYSEGEDPYRHIVVVMKRDLKRQNRAGRGSEETAQEAEQADE